MRTLSISFLIVAAALVHAQDARPFRGKELAEFLGPVPSNAFRWTKQTLVDFDLYNGGAMPPLSGHVGFYLGGHPDFKPDPGSTIVKGRLGIFPVKWYRSRAQNDSITQHALVRMDDYWRADVKVTAKRQQDVDQLINAVSQLPTFTKKPKPIGTQ